MRDFLLEFWPWLAGWAGVMSLLDFCLMGFDKHRAKRNGWRVRERTFFIVALLGGALGGVVGMRLFHHKTRHWYFVIGMPMILIAEVAIYLYFIR